jgi:Zn-dependent M16 (insulinase) family peptidase
MSGWKLETSYDFLNHKLQIHRHSSNFRIIFINVPGPLVTLSIVVPTVSEDDRGLAHTLEHLIFTGSKTLEIINISHPRGYLDTLATRSLSTGTNAYTSLDHTCYEIATAGFEGMLNIFPVFLEHGLNPFDFSPEPIVNSNSI